MIGGNRPLDNDYERGARTVGPAPKVVQPGVLRSLENSLGIVSKSVATINAPTPSSR